MRVKGEGKGGEARGAGRRGRREGRPLLARCARRERSGEGTGGDEKEAT